MVDGCQQPLAILAYEAILLDHALAQVYFLDGDVVDGRILDELHLPRVVEDLGVVALRTEELVHLPLRALQLAASLGGVDRQRKQNAAALQLFVGGEVEEEVVKQFVGGLRHRCLSDDLFGRVHARRVHRVGHHRIGTILPNRLRLLLRAAGVHCQHGDGDQRHHQNAFSHVSKVFLYKTRCKITTLFWYYVKRTKKNIRLLYTRE